GSPSSTATTRRCFRTRPTFPFSRAGASRCCSVRDRFTSPTPPTNTCRLPNCTPRWNITCRSPVSSSAAPEYERRLAERRRRIADLERSHLRLSNLRLLIAAVGAVVLWLALARAALSPWWAAAVWIVFGGVAVIHAKLLERTERVRRAERLYVRALERLAGRWAGSGRGRADFADGHPYARDLDLFGRASLFELMNTARTEAGESTLAAWLKHGADADAVRVRQAAVA